MEVAMSGAEESAEPIRRTLLQRVPVAAMPGWETRLYLIDYAAGADGSGHHHPVMGVGYVLSGSILSAFGDETPVLIRAGESFVDLADVVHTVARNGSETEALSFVVGYTVKENEPVTVLP
jgi:quercetin dioxygenase-like cupin family protein